MSPKGEKKTKGSTMGEVVTREYTINLHKRLHGIGFKYRAPRAVKEIKKFAEKQKRDIEGFTPEALEVIMSHKWPGNVRELENVMERVVTLETAKKIQAITLPPEMITAVRKLSGIPREMIIRANFMMGPVDLEKIVQDVRDFYRREALLYSKGNIEEADKLVGK